MTKIILLGAALVFMSGHAFAMKPCEELKAEIAAGLDAKGVKNYTLTIVANEEAGDKTVVGTCDGGTKKIVYERK